MRERRWSFHNAVGAPFELWVALLTIVNVVGFLTRPTVNPIHELVAPWDAVWAITYALAGILLFVGLVRERSSQFEAAGLCLLLAGVLVQLIVFASLGVSTLNGTWGTFVSLGSLAAITLWRLRIIGRASRAIRDLGNK